MAQPASRSDLINYCKRQLGAPVLEINVADEQIDDLIDDALQYFHERHFDGVTQTLLKYKITEDDINRGRTRGNNQAVGIVTTTAESTIVGTAVTFTVLVPLLILILGLGLALAFLIKNDPRTSPQLSAISLLSVTVAHAPEVLPTIVNPFLTNP